MPVFDEYTVGYADRSAAFDPAQTKHASAGYGIFPAPIIIRGRIVGSWRRELKKERVDIQVTPLVRFDRAQQQMITLAAERYGTFLGVKARVIRA